VVAAFSNWRDEHYSRSSMVSRSEMHGWPSPRCSVRTSCRPPVASVLGCDGAGKAWGRSLSCRPGSLGAPSRHGVAHHPRDRVRPTRRRSGLQTRRAEPVDGLGTCLARYLLRLRRVQRRTRPCASKRRVARTTKCVVMYFRAAAFLRGEPGSPSWSASPAFRYATPHASRLESGERSNCACDAIGFDGRRPLRLSSLSSPVRAHLSAASGDGFSIFPTERGIPRLEA